MWYLIYLLFAAWVLFDSSKRRMGSSRIGWTIGTALLGAIVAPIYFAKRPLKSGETREGGTAWNVLKNFALLWTLAMFFAAIIGMIGIGQVASQATSDAEQVGVGIGAALGLGFIATAWFFPMLGALVLGLFLKKSSIIEKGPTGPLAEPIQPAVSIS
jgi:hypothetical protein